MRFAWDGEQQGWIRADLPPLGMRARANPAFSKRCCLRSGSSKSVLSWRTANAQFLDVRGSLQHLIFSHLRERENVVKVHSLCGCLEWFPFEKS